VDGMAWREGTHFEVLKDQARLRTMTPRGDWGDFGFGGPVAGLVWTKNAIIEVVYVAGHVESRQEAEYELPDVVQGVLLCLGNWFVRREDGLSAESVSGQGSTSWNAPKESLELWGKYRAMVV